MPAVCILQSVWPHSMWVFCCLLPNITGTAPGCTNVPMAPPEHVQLRRIAAPRCPPASPCPRHPIVYQEQRKLGRETSVTAALTPGIRHVACVEVD